MFKKFIRSVARKLGYGIKKLAVYGYDFEKETNEAIRKVRSYTMLPRERLLALYDQVVFCEKNEIPGCFVECGVWKGGSVALMAIANLKHGERRRHIHLFDVFKEICEPDPLVDGDRAIRDVKKWLNREPTGELKPLTGVYDRFGGPGSLDGNRDLLEGTIGYDPNFLHYHKGWFQNTLPMESQNITDIAVLRLDSDWYASTKICLEHLYDKVVNGGFIIIDDYGAYEGCKKATDDFLQNTKKKDISKSCGFGMQIFH